MNILCPLHVSATLVAIFREVHYEEWIYRDIANVYDKMHRSKVLNFNNVLYFINFCNISMYPSFLYISLMMATRGAETCRKHTEFMI
jgi:hypothetical protein